VLRSCPVTSLVSRPTERFVSRPIAAVCGPMVQTRWPNLNNIVGRNVSAGCGRRTRTPVERANRAKAEAKWSLFPFCAEAIRFAKIGFLRILKIPGSVVERRGFAQNLAHADSFFDAVPEFPVELDNTGVRLKDLQVDLGTAQFSQGFFDVVHERGADFLSAMGRINGERIDPAAVSVETSHHGASDLLVDHCDEKEFRLHGHFLADHGRGIVPRLPIGQDLFPERDNIAFVRLIVDSDPHWRAITPSGLQPFPIQ
jgi:hypothetical protein